MIYQGHELELTPTEERLLVLLLDGQPHSRQELIAHGMEGDELTEASALRTHLSSLRTKLRPTGTTVIAQSLGTYVRFRLMGYVSQALNECLNS